MYIFDYTVMYMLDGSKSKLVRGANAKCNT